jgi:hypothetical protein
MVCHKTTKNYNLLNLKKIVKCYSAINRTLMLILKGDYLYVSRD